MPAGGFIHYKSIREEADGNVLVQVVVDDGGHV